MTGPAEVPDESGGEPTDAESRCQFTFDPAAWNEQHERRSPLSEPWTCPRAAVDDDGYDCCPFHLSPSERSEIGIGDDELRSRFREAVETRGQRPKEFVGATFDTLALRYQRLAAPDAHPINFAHAEFEGDLDLTRTTFGQPLFLGATRIERLVASDTRFEAPVYLLDARVGEVDFTAADLALLDLRGVRTDGRVTLREATVEATVRCMGATFSDYVRAEGCTCEGTVDFSDATLEKPLDLDGSSVGTLRLNETDGTRFDLRDLVVEERLDADYLSAEVVDAGNADIGGTASLKRSHIERTLEFRGTTAERLDCSGATVGTNLHLNQAIVAGDTFLRDLTVMGVFDASHAVFERTRLNGSTFQGPSRLRNTEFAGETSVGSATFQKHADFTDATFAAEARFLGTAFHADATFEGCRFRDPIIVELEAVERQLSVSFSGATIDSGRITCLDGVEYDFADAKLGDVYFDAEAVANPCFEYLAIANTTFDGFDFGRYKRQLKESNWRLHSTAAVAEERHFPEDTGRNREGKPTESGTLSPSVLENTYLKAKNGAKAVGDNQSAAEFFRLEMIYRRHQHFAQAATSRNRVAERIVGGARWGSNFLLDVTSGYGERPSRVVLFSIGVILAFATGYSFVAQSSFEAGQFGEEYLLFSFQSYVTFILSNPVGPGAGFALRFLSAVEGFVGAFLVALFVFTLTRSIHR